MSKKSGRLAKKYKVRRVVLVILAAMFITVSAAGVYASLEMGGSLRDPGTVTVEIPKGSSVVAIAQILKKSGVIGSEALFRVYLKTSGQGADFQYGTFTLTPREGYGPVALALSELVARRDTVVVTFPEGYNAYQIAEVLTAAGLCTEQEFTDALAQYDTSRFEFLSGVSQNEHKLVALEGFLFPDTYELYTNEAPDSIITRMLGNFENKVLTPERVRKIEESGLSLEQLIIFASIVQKEAANVEEMYNVSSVFHNRMDNEAEYPRLESCTTNNYINDYIRVKIERPSAELLDAYDTYSRSGLPVAAIANPGLSAIDATLSPNDTPYYFFVTDIEFTHYYGKNFSEHTANIEKAKAVNLRYGKIGL